MTGGTARARVLVGILAVGVALAGCGGSNGSSEEATAGSGDLSGEVVVLAAASLTDTFTALADDFERQHPGVTVTFSFGASSALVQQVQAGAPADLLATANTSTMDQVADLTEGTRVFARNSLQIAVPTGNPGGVQGIDDFADPELRLALCAVEVPCGAAAAQMFDAAGIVPRPDTYEKDVSATLTKVAWGEVDAAVVYRTDVISAGDRVQGIDVPADVDVINDYPIAVLTEARNPAAATAFTDYVLSDAGQDALAAAGFVAD